MMSVAVCCLLLQEALFSLRSLHFEGPYPLAARVDAIEHGAQAFGVNEQTLHIGFARSAGQTHAPSQALPSR